MLGVYGFLDEAGEIITVKYSSNNSTGFTTDNKLPEQVQLLMFFFLLLLEKKNKTESL